MSGEEVGRLLEGKVLQGRYHLRSLLAFGGFGAVFHAEHRVLGELVRQVAVKVTAHTGLTRDQLRSVFGEAIVSARVYDSLEGSGATKFLVPVYDMGLLADHADRGFIVLGLVRGAGSTAARCAPPQTLAETIRNWSGAMSSDVAAEYMRRICEAVAALHSQQVIHRDLKPDNILLSEHGQVRLVDLGLAADLGSDGHAYGHAGTLQYMAPETGLEGRSSRASDVYALGLIAYELLTGSNPFGRLRPPPEVDPDRRSEWLQQQKMTVRILAPSAYRTGVPAWLDRLTLRCLDPRPVIRPQSASELRDAIAAAGMDQGSDISGADWAAWFGERPALVLETEAGRLEQFLLAWGTTRRNAVWFEAATKLAVCYLSMANSEMQTLTQLLSNAEELVRRGEVLASYQERANWYGGLASVMERHGRAALIRYEYRDHERDARRHL